MNREIVIGDIRISENRPALVIPEVGINHNGSLTIAKEMVDSAKRAGAQLIKHQTHVCWDEMRTEIFVIVWGSQVN